jgi:tetratricopeptide (TPR) repeat protein
MLLLALGGPVFAGALAMMFGGRTRVGFRKDLWKSIYAVKSGRLQEGLDYAEKHISRRPNEAQGWEAKAVALWTLGRLEEALACADRALRIARTWRGYMIRGQILSFLGSNGAAVSDLEESLRFWRHANVEIAKGAALVAQRRLDDALRVLLRAGRWGGRWSTGYSALGDAYRLRGDKTMAQEAYRSGVRRARREIAAGMPMHSTLGYCLAQLGQEADAADAAGDGLRFAEQDTSCLRTQTLLNVGQGELGWAEQKLHKMLLIAPGSVVETLTDPQCTPLLSERRFRELLAWALGAHRQMVRRLRVEFPHLFPA